MKIVQRMEPDKPLTVTIEYPVMDQEARTLIQRIKNLDVSLIGWLGEQQSKISSFDIYYIETVDRKTFLYTRDLVYQMEGSLRDYEECKLGPSFVKVSKNCIINTDCLRDIKQLKNSHLEATMENGEKVIVSRRYLQNVKKVFREERW